MLHRPECYHLHHRKKCKSLLWPGAFQYRIYYHRIWGQLPTTGSNLLKQPTGELLVAVDHNQLRKVASEKIDPIDGLHSPPSWALPNEGLVHSINRSSLSHSWVELATSACEATTLPIRSLRGDESIYRVHTYLQQNSKVP